MSLQACKNYGTHKSWIQQLKIEQFQFGLLGLHSKCTVQITCIATIGEGCSFPLSLYFVPCSNTYETLNLWLPCGCPLQLHVLVLVRPLGKSSWTFQKKNPNGTRKFPKAHCSAWSNVISFSPMAAPSSNPIIQSRHVRILQDPYWSRVSSGSQKYRNTMSDGLSDSILWRKCGASWDHEFTNWRIQALI